MCLLQLEWKKLSPNRCFKIAAAMYFVLLPLLFLAVKVSSNANGRSSNNVAMNILQSNYQFPKIWDTVAYWARWLTFFLLVYVAIWMVSSEYEYRTARQNFITGMERKHYLYGKFQMLLTLIFGCTLYMAIVAATFGYIAEDMATNFHGLPLLLCAISLCKTYSMLVLHYYWLYSLGRAV